MRRLAILCVVLGSLALTAGTVVRSKSNIRNNRIAPAAYVVVRPVFTAADAKHTASAPVYQRTVYFDPSETLVDLSGIDLTKVRVQSGVDHYVVMLPLKRPIAGKQIGIFLDGKLVAAPMLKSSIDAIIVENSFTEAEATKVAERIRRGGTE